MMIQDHIHKNISNDNDNEYYITIFFDDRISYYRYNNNHYLSQNFDYDKISDYKYIHSRKISDYNYIQNIRNFNYNPFYLDKISSCKTIEKLSDYNYIDNKE